jgi:serine/threonine-protein kinase
MGEVYRAEDLKLGQAVALKFLPDPIDEVRLRRFYAEVRLGRQVAHPNVCRIYDVIEADARHFLVMEYVDGEDLASLLRRIGRPQQDKGLEIARGLCAGLAAAHEKGVLHRDLKPANVMIDGRGYPRIMDFGLAVLAGETEGDDHAGTPAYMAPEQLVGEQVTVRTDIYSLGLVLYELFTGRRAWDAESVGQQWRMRLDSAPTAPSSLVPDLDRGVERVIMGCLTREPSARPGTAVAVLASLPGGDPLQAAIALGETPSPEMVAAAGVVGDLSARAAWTWLGIALLSLVGVLWLSERVMLHRLVPLPKSPEVLLDRAKALAAKLAPGETIADSAWGGEADLEYLRDIARRDPSPERWKRLGAERPGPLAFWYRESRAPLVARTWTPLALWIPGARPVGRVTREQPPPIMPGMQEVVLDPGGRLLMWQRVPARGDSPDVDIQATLGWLFTEAGLEAGKFTRETSLGLSAEGAIRWHGPFPDSPGRAQVDASIHDARLSLFAVARDDGVQPAVTYGRVISNTSLDLAVRAFLLFLLPITFGIVALAIRNLRLKRGDRRGAFRIAFFGAVTVYAALKLGVHFPSTLYDAFDLWIVSDAQAIQWAVLGWFCYVALEPELRRTWPHTLISWSRLISSRWRDPLVGRDVLLGVTAGLLYTCLRLGGPLIPAGPQGPPPRPLAWAAAALASSWEALAVLLQWLYSSVLLGVGLLLFLLLFFRLTRSRPAALFLLWLVGLIVVLPVLEALPFSAAITASLMSVLLVAVVFRLGLLSTAVMIYIHFTQMFLPSTTDPSVWYAGVSALGLAVVVGLAVCGFLVSLGGKPLFGRSVLEA